MSLFFNTPVEKARAKYAFKWDKNKEKQSSEEAIQNLIQHQQDVVKQSLPVNHHGLQH